MFLIIYKVEERNADIEKQDSKNDSDLYRIFKTKANYVVLERSLIQLF